MLMWLPVDDVGGMEKSSCSHGLSHRAGHAAHSVARTSLTPLTPCSHLPPPTQQLYGVLFANTPAPPAYIPRLVELLPMQPPPYPPEIAAPMELGPRTQSVQGEKRASLFFVHCKQSSTSGKDPFCSTAPHRSDNVSWARGRVKKNSLENDKHYSKNFCTVCLSSTATKIDLLL